VDEILGEELFSNGSHRHNVEALPEDAAGFGGLPSQSWI
jgi:hypothetical protein